MGEKEVNKERKRIGEREREREREIVKKEERERERETRRITDKVKIQHPPYFNFFEIYSLPIFNILFLLTVFFHHHGINIACCVFVFKG